MTEHRVILGDVRLHVVEQGEGPMVLLIHGFPETSYAWRHQLPALAAAGYRAVAMDVRGYGRSSKPASRENYRMVELVGDAAGLVSALGLTTAAVIGHDWGSLIAANAALLEWGGAQGLTWDRHDTPAGDAFGGRYERYLTDPKEEPDEKKWETEVAIRVAAN
jgi:pimeloyl-ACP methyl ester carboxylesterase